METDWTSPNSTFETTGDGIVARTWMVRMGLGVEFGEREMRREDHEFLVVGHPGHFVVVLRNRALVKYAGMQFKESRVEDGKYVVRKEFLPGEGAKMTYEWEDWGPRNTRWFRERTTSSWLRCVSYTSPPPFFFFFLFSPRFFVKIDLAYIRMRDISHIRGRKKPVLIL